MVDYSKLSNWLKLRYSARFTDKLAFEAGLDVAPFKGFSLQPGWALHYEVPASFSLPEMHQCISYYLFMAMDLIHLWACKFLLPA